MSQLLQVAPGDIERTSFEILTRELGDRLRRDETTPVVQRVIHTTADFDYAETLCFSDQVIARAKEALRAGATLVTDTRMALAGINKAAAARLGCTLCCFIDDPAVAEAAAREGSTRSAAAVDRAVALPGPLIFVVGNAPTALLRLRQRIDEGAVRPALIVGVPVGFVNVEAAKEGILACPVPHIVARGRKGGSTVAAAICNALLYDCLKET